MNYLLNLLFNFYDGKKINFLRGVIWGILIFIFLLSISGCTTVKYVMVDPKDSTKLIEIRKRVMYDDMYYSPNFMFSPFYYNWYTRPYYYSPRVYIAPQPRFEQRPRQGDPFPKPPIPHAPIRQFPNQPNRRN